MEQRRRARPNTPERFLWPKPGARHLWFRLHVPVRFRRVESRKIIQQSLGTSDRREASLRAAELRVGLMREWEQKIGAAHASLSVPSEADLQRAATTFGYLRTADMVAEWWTDDKTDEAGCHGRFIDRLERKRRQFVEKRETTMAAFWRYVADHLASENGWRLDAGNRNEFAQMIVEAAIDRLRVEMETLWRVRHVTTCQRMISQYSLPWLKPSTLASKRLISRLVPGKQPSEG